MNNRERVNQSRNIIVGQLQKQRWYPLKNYDPERLEITTIYPDIGEEGESIFVEMTGNNRKINLLLNFRNDSVNDSIADCEVVTFIDQVLSHKFENLKFKGNETLLMENLKSCRALNANQSNSSFVLNNSLIGKFMRTYSDLSNPDFVIPLKLWEEAYFRDIPEPVGLIEFKQEQCLFSFFRFLPGSGDYWSYLYERINFQNGKQIIEEESEKLSELTARLHVALSTIKGSEFEPESLTESDIVSMESSMGQYCDKLLNICRSIKQTNSHAAQILEKSTLLESRIHSLHLFLNCGLKKQRIHGDYHLGQILKTEAGAKIIDFEGEPMRSSAYRIAKQSPMKDLAGLIRSFDYLCSSKLGENKSINIESERIIIDAYLRKRSSTDRNFSMYTDQFRKLIGIFILEKAIYEAIYEYENRPEWINIPLSYISYSLSK